MDTKTSEIELRQYLLDGLFKEIFLAEEARTLCFEVGKYAEILNEKGYGRLFGSLQACYSNQQTLCITKLFDPVGRYPTRSIPGVIRLIQKRASHWSLPERWLLEERLAMACHNPELYTNMENREIALAIAEYFESTLPGGCVAQVGLCDALNSLKQSRDKVIAHNEAIDPIARKLPRWNEAELLVNYSRDFLSLISRGFLGVYVGDEKSLLGDSHTAAVYLRRLIKAARLDGACGRGLTPQTKLL
jgi:AbiU2